MLDATLTMKSSFQMAAASACLSCSWEQIIGDDVNAFTISVRAGYPESKQK